MISITQVQSLDGRPYTFGLDDSTYGKFGGAWPDGALGMHDYRHGQRTHRRIKCSTYRKAQRKLLQWLNGYNV